MTIKETTIKETTMITADSQPIELDFRAQDGVEVSLLWKPENDVVLVEVHDGRTGQSFQLVVDAEEALDVFRHPFAYAAFRGVWHAAEEATPLAA